MPSYSASPIGLLTAGTSSSAAPAGQLTLAVLGCGAMGIAILSGMLASIAEMDAPRPLQVVASGPSSGHSSGHGGSSASGTSTPVSSATDEVPERLPGRFIACVRRTESAKKVKAALWAHSSAVKVVQNDNVHAAQLADVVLLACKADAVPTLLAEPGMVLALHGKLLISICAGVTVEQIEADLHGGMVPTLDPAVDGRCRVVRAMPNAAALVRESMTVIAASQPPLPPSQAALVTWIFRRIGDVAYLPREAMDASTALCGSGPAFFSLLLEAAVDGAVAMGLPRAEAIRMAAQSMRGTASLVLHGDHPALLRDRITTPGGCTIGGLMVLEEGGVRGTVARAVRESTTVASQLGKGVEGVNRTRF